MKAAFSFLLLLLSFYSGLLSQEPERDTVEGILYQVIEKQRGILPLVNPDNIEATIGTIQMLDSLKSQSKNDGVMFDLKKNINGKEKSYESVLASYRKEISEIVLKAILKKYDEINNIIKNRTTEFQIIGSGGEGFGKTLRKIGNSAKDLFKKKILRSKTESDYSDAAFKIINPAIEEPFKGNRLEYLYSELLTVTKKSLEIGQLINIYTVLLKNDVSQENLETQNTTIANNLEGLVNSVSSFLDAYSSYNEQKQQTVPYLIALTLEYRNTANAIIENSIEYLNVRVAQAKETDSISKNFNTFLQQELFPTVQKITDDNVAANNSSLQHKNSQLNTKISHLQLENQQLKRQVEDLRLQMRHTKITSSMEGAEPESVEGSSAARRTIRIPETSSSSSTPTIPSSFDSVNLFKANLTKSQLDAISRGQLQEHLTEIDDFIRLIPTNNTLLTTKSYKSNTDFLRSLLNETQIKKEKDEIKNRLQQLTDLYQASHIKDIEEITQALQTFKKTLYENTQELELAKNTIQNKITHLENLQKDNLSADKRKILDRLKSILQKIYEEKFDETTQIANIVSSINNFENSIFTKTKQLEDSYEIITEQSQNSTKDYPILRKEIKNYTEKLNNVYQVKLQLTKRFEEISNNIEQFNEKNFNDKGFTNDTERNNEYKKISEAITLLENEYSANNKYNKAIKDQISLQLKERLKKAEKKK